MTDKIFLPGKGENMGLFTKETRGLDQRVKDPKAYPGTVVITEPNRIGKLLGIRPRALVEHTFTTGKQTSPLPIETARAWLGLD